MNETLKFNSIVCDNFLPYYHEKISFPDKEGILIINGNNGHGKSSLITAIRFVLFGKFGGNVADGDLSELEIINKDGFIRGNYKFSVTLDVDYLGCNYLITRSCSPKNNSKEPPKSSDDYKSPELIVTSEGITLSDNERDKLLNKIMNENLSRFYLFDGELLEEYKRLLSGKRSDESKKIKTSIENLLGLPLLTNAKKHLDDILSELQQKYLEAANISEETAHFAKLLSSEERNCSKLKEELKYWNDELTKQNNILNKCTDEKLGYEDDIQLSKKFAVVESNLERIIGELENNKSNLGKCLSDVWKIPLYPLINDIGEKYTKKSHSLDREKIIVENTKKTLTDLYSSLSSAKCKLCNQCTLDEETKTYINNQISKLQKELESLPDIEQINNELYSIQETERHIYEFKKIYDSSSLGTLRRTYESLWDLQTKKAETQIQYDSLKEDLSNSIDPAYLKKLEETETQAIAKRENCKHTCADLEKQIDEVNTRITNLNRKLNSLNYMYSTLKDIETDKEKVTKLLSLFEKGVDVYRNKKKEAVEQSASSLYCKLSEAQVGGLHISDKYSVSYYDKNGKELPRPSSGYSHLQAFALIGGLHQNMPIKGPLFLDTPSSRLDSANTTNLLRVFPELSSQIILLITDKDFDRVELHNTLHDKIVAEYNIEKITNTHSRIVEVKCEVK